LNRVFEEFVLFIFGQLIDPYRVSDTLCWAARQQTLDNLVFTLISKAKHSSLTSPTLITSVTMMPVTLSFIDERQVLTVIQPMLPLHECADPALAEFTAEPLHSVGDSAAVEEFAIEPLHSAVDPAAAEPLQSVADSDAAADAPIDAYCS
jgi:hypothetical protein